MTSLIRYSPFRLAAIYVALSALVLSLFAAALWYGWHANIATFRGYVDGNEVQRLVDAFRAGGPDALVADLAARAGGLPADEIVVFADPQKRRLAGNLSAWPAEVPDRPGTYGLVIGTGGDEAMRVVASHVALDDGYRLLVGRESARFQSLVDLFWYGMGGAIGVALFVGTLVGWLSRRALLAEVQEMSRTASAIAEGDLSRRIEAHGHSAELGSLETTVNGLLERLARNNAQLSQEVAVRGETEAALQRARDKLEVTVAERTRQLLRANESLARSETLLTEAQRISRTGSFSWCPATDEVNWSEQTYRIFGMSAAIKPTMTLTRARVHPEDLEIFEQQMHRIALSTAEFEFEHRLLMPAGEVKHVRVVGVTLDSREVLGAVTDVTQQERARGELNAAKARFEGMLAIAEDAIISIDRAGRITLFNRGAERIFGYASSDILGRPLDVLLPERVIGAHRDHVDEFARSGDIARAMGERREVFGVRSSGEEFPAEASISKLDLGEDLVFTVILRDITERKCADEALRRSEAYLAEAQRLSRTGSFGWDVSSGRLTWSDETYAIVGLPRDTPPTIEAVDACVHPDDRALVRNTFESAAALRAPIDFEHRFLRDDGSVSYVHVRARAITSPGGRLEYVGAVSDVTALKHSQQALECAFREMQTLRDDMRLALDSIPALAWSALADGHIDFLNQRWREYTGLTMAEAGGWGWQVAIHPDDLSGLAAYWQGILAAGADGEYVARLRRHDGVYRWFLFRGVPLRDDAGVVVKWYGTNTDIEERKRAESTLADEMRVLELIAKGSPLPEILEWVCRQVEADTPGTCCSILLLDAARRRLLHGAGPSLPKGYAADIEDWPLEVGPCGLAAAEGRAVISADIAQDGRWPRYQAHAIAHGFRACWSTPIMSSEGSVLGTFAILKREPSSPWPQDFATISRVTHIASIAIERKEAEDRLRRSEAFLSEGQRISNTGSWGWRLATGEVVWSQNQYRLLGFEATDGKPSVDRFLSIVHEDDRDRVREKLESATRRGESYTIDYRVPLAGGAIRHLRSVGRPAASDRDEVDEYIGVTIDMTERVHAEAALKRSEERHALAMRAAGEGHWDWLIETDEFYGSPRMLEMYGFPPETTFAGRAEFLNCFPFHPEDRPKWEAAAAAHFAGNTSRFDIEIRMVPRGEVRWIHLTGLLLRDETGKPVRWTGSVADVTERKRAEEELRARQEMLDLAQQAARAVAFEWRRGAPEERSPWPSSWRVSVSTELESIFGVAPGSFDGSYEGWKNLIHSDDWPSVKEAILKSQNGGDMDLEYRIVQPGGTTRWLQSKGRVLVDARGEPERVVGFVLDITGRRQAEDELRRLERRLRQAQRLEAMGTLAGGIAHDFNNILGAILGYGEMAQRGVAKDSRLRRDLDSIVAAGERGRALVDRILAFSRSGLGERVTVHVQRIVREAIDMLEPSLPKGIRIEARLRAGSAAIVGDPTQVHQVVMNLGTNAIQAMPDGGTLVVSLDIVRVESARQVMIGALEAGEYLLLRVADTGTGIPREIFDRIFDPFFTTKEVGIGTGLGLSLVHGIVADLGGALDVTSAPGAGSSFMVYLPRSGDADERSSGHDSTMPRGRGQQVLIVDDEQPLVDLTATTLRELGYEPLGCTSSAAALEVFRDNPDRFDAVITDERMPGMSGSALIREVRRVRSSIAILLVSGYVGGLVAGRAYNEGADEVLKKPLSARELATSLARVLQAHPRVTQRDV